MGLGPTLATESTVAAGVMTDDQAMLDRLLSKQARATRWAARDKTKDEDGDADRCPALTPDELALVATLQGKVLPEKDGDESWMLVPTGWTAVSRVTRTRTLMYRACKPTQIGNVRCARYECGKFARLKTAFYVRPIEAVSTGARTKNGAIQPPSKHHFIEQHSSFYVCSLACSTANTQYKQDRPDKSKYPAAAFRRDKSSGSFTDPRHMGGKGAARSATVKAFPKGSVKHAGPTPQAMPYTTNPAMR